MKQQRLKKGFSLVEIIVAMALIVIIAAVGYSACLVAIRMSAGGENEMRAYTDFEKFRLSLDGAFERIGGDVSQKESYLSALAENVEWYFEAEGLARLIQSKPLDESDWTVELNGISVCYFGENSPIYAFEIKKSGAGYYSQCNLDCREDGFYATLAAYKDTSSKPFYTLELKYGAQHEAL